MGVKTEIWASRLRFEGRTEEEEEEKEEKIPHMCESIGIGRARLPLTI